MSQIGHQKLVDTFDLNFCASILHLQNGDNTCISQGCCENNKFISVCETQILLVMSILERLMRKLIIFVLRVELNRAAWNHTLNREKK